MLKIAHSKLGDVCTREDIEEAVSDIFVIFLKAAEKRSFEIKSVKAFLSVIAKRRCMDIYRSVSRKTEEVSFEEIENYVGESAEEQKSERERLLCALKTLDNNDREIFIGKYWPGQKSRDIANDMGLKTNTVDKRISRGILKLKKMLEED